MAFSTEIILILLNPKIENLIKIGNEIYKWTKTCNIICPGNDQDALSELWSPDRLIS